MFDGSGKGRNEMKDFINDEEFERLNFHEQRDYRWCRTCECYYHIESNHACNSYNVYMDGVVDPRD